MYFSTRIRKTDSNDEKRLFYCFQVLSVALSIWFFTGFHFTRGDWSNIASSQLFRDNFCYKRSVFSVLDSECLIFEK